MLSVSGDTAAYICLFSRCKLIVKVAKNQSNIHNISREERREQDTWDSNFVFGRRESVAKLWDLQVMDEWKKDAFLTSSFLPSSHNRSFPSSKLICETMSGSDMSMLRERKLHNESVLSVC